MKSLYPFPHFVGEKRHSGSIQDWPPKCLNCTSQECLKGKGEEIETCSRGFNYLRLGPETIAAGVVVQDMPVISTAQKSVRKSSHTAFLRKEQLLNSQKAWAATEAHAKIAAREKLNQTIENYIEKEVWKPAFIKQFEAEIRKGLSFVHDYKQVNMQLAQNINVIIENKYSASSFQEKLKQSSKEERAIYEASKFLEEKLGVAKFLMNPERLEDGTLCCGFRFHGLVHKYSMIYSPRFIAKSVTANQAGQSFGTVFANPEAVAVIPHTLIDNAAKYAPEQSTAEIITQDLDNGIQFEVSSYGPRIEDDEIESIFRPFYRGRNAEQLEEEGAGFGLYIAQLVCKRHLGTEITVRQNLAKTRDKRYWTSFRVDIPARALVGRQ